MIWFKIISHWLSLIHSFPSSNLNVYKNMKTQKKSQWEGKQGLAVNFF